MVKNRMKELRIKKGLTLKELAKQLNNQGVSISSSSLIKYERGERTPRIEILSEISKFYGVSTDYLLGRDGINQIEENKKGTSDEMSLDKALDSVMSYDGSPITDRDRETMKKLWKAYLDSKK